MQVVLVMFRGDSGRRSFSLTRDVTIIGRREDCDFRIPLSEISRRHCRVIQAEQGLRVEDMGSSNGTYVNGARVQESALQPGDTLHIGSVAFVVQVDGVPAEDQLQPVPLPSAVADTTAGAEASTNGRATTIGATPDADESTSAQPIDAAEPVDIGLSESAGPGRTGEEVFDPMAVLGSSEDSAANAQIDGSQIGHEVMGDVEQTHKPQD